MRTEDGVQGMMLSPDELYLREQERLRAAHGRAALSIRITSAAVLVIVIGLMFLLSSRVNVILFPSPLAVVSTLVKGLIDGRLAPHLLITLAETILGFGIGVPLGIGVGVLLSESPTIRGILNPYIIVSQSVPKVALAPMFILWLGFGLAPKVAIAALITFFPLLENTVVGLQSVEPEVLMLLQSLRASRWQTLWKLRFPHALPFIFAGIRVAMVFSVIGAVVGEYIGANRGLGALMIVAQGMVDSALLFAVFVLLSALGIGLYKLAEVVERTVLRRRGFA